MSTRQGSHLFLIVLATWAFIREAEIIAFSNALIAKDCLTLFANSRFISHAMTYDALKYVIKLGLIRHLSEPTEYFHDTFLAWLRLLQLFGKRIAQLLSVFHEEDARQIGF